MGNCFNNTTIQTQPLETHSPAPVAPPPAFPLLTFTADSASDCCICYEPIRLIQPTSPFDCAPACRSHESICSDCLVRWSIWKKKSCPLCRSPPLHPLTDLLNRN